MDRFQEVFNRSDDGLSCGFVHVGDALFFYVHDSRFVYGAFTGERFIQGIVDADDDGRIIRVGVDHCADNDNRDSNKCVLLRMRTAHGIVGDLTFDRVYASSPYWEDDEIHAIRDAVASEFGMAYDDLETPELTRVVASMYE